MDIDIKKRDNLREKDNGVKTVVFQLGKLINN